VSAPRADRFTPVKQIRHPFYKRLSGPRSLSERAWKVHPYPFSNPGPSITQRVVTCITLSRPTIYKSKEDTYGTTTIFITSDVVKEPRNINVNAPITFICSFDTLNLSSYNVRSLFTACKHIYRCCIPFLGDFPASEFYVPTFLNILSFPSS